jgi:excisionase family DNA binding protein
MSKPLTTRQAAEALGVEPSTVRIWIAQGKLPAWRVGTQGDWKVDPADIEAVKRPAEFHQPEPVKRLKRRRILDGPAKLSDLFRKQVKSKQ